MALPPRQPVLVGAGQVTVRDGAPLAPIELMAAAARAAAIDAGAPSLLERVQSVAVVDAISAPLGDPAAALAEALGATPAETVTSGIGGNGPQLLVDDLAARIAGAGLDVALIAGAEAMATVTALMKRGEPAPWPQEDGGRTPTRSVGDGRPGSSAVEDAAGLIAPIFFYPAIEHALRAAAGRSREDHLTAISELWAGFAAVAAENPHAWTRDAPSAKEIATPAAGNRKVSDPYNKLHNAHIAVDQGAALLLTSVEAASRAGIPREDWVVLHAGAHAHDHWFVTERDELHRSPAIRLAGEAALAHAGIAAADLGPVDLYSCFPSAVQIAAHELGLGTDRPLTVTGGLTFAGGPGNAYSLHGIATLAGRLRAEPSAYGLATALGWYATKHALGVYSCADPERPFAAFDVQDAVDALPSRAVAAGFEGEGVVETYTALYERDGSPGMGIVVARLEDGRRALAKSHDADALAELVGDADPLGRPVRVSAPEGFELR